MLIPSRMPITLQNPSQIANGMSSAPYEMYMNEEANVENMIIYIPVEVDTVGGTPSSIIRGLKTLPPPSPKAPETQPPMKANTIR